MVPMLAVEDRPRPMLAAAVLVLVGLLHLRVAGRF
jgi:hypothetical protein